MSKTNIMKELQETIDELSKEEESEVRFNGLEMYLQNLIESVEYGEDAKSLKNLDEVAQFDEIRTSFERLKSEKKKRAKEKLKDNYVLVPKGLAYFLILIVILYLVGFMYDYFFK